MQKHQATYKTTNTYSTLNTLTERTKKVWFCLHGMGYLSHYFIKYFEDLDAKENYIIAPQAPNKYYQDKKFKYIGASWLTREDIDLEKENIFRYLDEIWAIESRKWKQKDIEIILMGYSQGVSIITRWMSSRALHCDHLLLHSGAIPEELTEDDFKYLPKNTKVTYLYGDNDEYITEARKTEQQIKSSDLFGKRLVIQVFKGKHEVNVSFLKKLSENKT